MDDVLSRLVDVRLRPAEQAGPCLCTVESPLVRSSRLSCPADKSVDSELPYNPWYGSYTENRLQAMSIDDCEGVQAMPPPTVAIAKYLVHGEKEQNGRDGLNKRRVSSREMAAMTPRDEVALADLVECSLAISSTIDEQRGENNITADGESPEPVSTVAAENGRSATGESFEQLQEPATVTDKNSAVTDTEKEPASAAERSPSESRRSADYQKQTNTPGVVEQRQSDAGQSAAEDVAPVNTGQTETTVDDDRNAASDLTERVLGQSHRGQPTSAPENATRDEQHDAESKENVERSSKIVPNDATSKEDSNATKVVPDMSVDGNSPGSRDGSHQTGRKCTERTAAQHRETLERFDILRPVRFQLAGSELEPHRTQDVTDLGQEEDMDIDDDDDDNDDATKGGQEEAAADVEINSEGERETTKKPTISTDIGLISDEAGATSRHHQQQLEETERDLHTASIEDRGTDRPTATVKDSDNSTVVITARISRQGTHDHTVTVSSAQDEGQLPHQFTAAASDNPPPNGDLSDDVQSPTTVATQRESVTHHSPAPSDRKVSRDLTEIGRRPTYS